MKILKDKYLRGFTIIELLIVIAILGVLAVALLITINPAEAQKKARDIKRLNDLKTLQTVIDQYISDGGVVAGAITTNAAGVNTTGLAAGSQACTASWLAGLTTATLCTYTRTIPTDPNNGTSKSVVTGGTVAAPTFTVVPVIYAAKIVGADYEINVMQESGSNAAKVLNDGSNNNSYVEAGTLLTLIP